MSCIISVLRRWNKSSYLLVPLYYALNCSFSEHFYLQLITNINCTKFLGLIIDSTLSWKDHVREITPKLNKAFYVIRTLTFLRSPEVLRMVYFSYFHFIMLYGIIFWGNSHHSVNIFKIQKRIIRIITNSNR